MALRPPRLRAKCSKCGVQIEDADRLTWATPICLVCLPPPGLRQERSESEGKRRFAERKRWRDAVEEWGEEPTVREPAFAPDGETCPVCCGPCQGH